MSEEFTTGRASSSSEALRSSPIGRPTSASSPVRKKLKLDADLPDISSEIGETCSSVSASTTTITVTPNSTFSTTSSSSSSFSSLSLEARKMRLHERRAARLKALIGSYRDNMAELFFLQSSGNLVDFSAFKKKTSFAFYNYLKTSGAPDCVLSEVAAELPPTTSSSTSSLSSTSTSMTSALANSAETTTLPLTPIKTAVSSEDPVTPPPLMILPPTVQIPLSTGVGSTTATTSASTASTLTETSTVSTSNSALTTTTTTTTTSTLPSSNQRVRPSYHPKVSFISPVKYGENLQKTTHLMTNSHSATTTATTPSRIAQLSREQLSEKLKQESWVVRRVQDLIKEGLWTKKRLPKVAEKSRPRCHWDLLFNEMQWLAVDFYQERKWKKEAARMLAYSAKEYVEKLEERRAAVRREEELRIRRVASFVAGEIRSFWAKISQISEFKLQRQQRVIQRQMLDQQLAYVTQDKGQCQGTSKTNNTNNNNNKADENGVDSDREDSVMDLDDDDDNDDDESTILEQELFEQEEMLSSPKFNRELELAKLHADSRTPLSKLLKSVYPGVLSEYLDLYEELLNDQCSSASEDSSEESEFEDSETDILAENSSFELSIDSLLKTLTASDKSSSNRRDINDLAEEADQFKPPRTSFRCTSSEQHLPLLKGQLRDYQKIGVDWLISMHQGGFNAALADEPGLGRKVMIIAFFSWLALNDPPRKPHLVIAPVSSLSGFSTLLRSWCPSLTVQEYDGPEKVRKSLRKRWSGHKIVLTSYRVFFQDSYYFLKHSWNYLVLHEAQNLGRVGKMTSVLDLKSRQRISILSEPLPSNPIDLWNLLYLLQPKTYLLHRELAGTQTFVEGTEEYFETVKKLHAVINPFLLRRTRSQLEKQLPVTQEKVYLLEMLPRQRRLYDDYLDSAGVRSAVEKGELDIVAGVLRKLRKICDHPSLVYNNDESPPLVLPRLDYKVPSFVYSATDYDPFVNVDLNSMNFIFFTHETTLTVIISDRIRKSRASKSLIEEFPSKLASSNIAPTVPSARLTLEFQTSPSSNVVARPTSSQLVQTASGQHILLSTSVIKSLKSSSVNRTTSSTVETTNVSDNERLGAYHKESLRVIATFNERRCMGLPLYGKDLVDMLTIVTTLRPLRSKFRGMGYVNCLNAFESSESKIKDKNRFRYQTSSLRRMVNATSVAFRQIHSDTSIPLFCYNAPVILASSSSSSRQFKGEEDLNRLLHSVYNKEPALRSHFTHAPSWNFPPSAKLDKLGEILRKVADLKERAIIFCEIREMRDLIRIFLRRKFYSFEAIDPEDSLESKLESLHQFFIQNSKQFILTSIQTSFLGVHLSSSNISHIIFYDSDWGSKSNPWVQAISRSDNATIHRLLCKGSVEENISRKNLQKRLLTDLKLGDNCVKISKQTLEDLFSRHVGDNGTIRLTELPMEKEARRKEKSRVAAKEEFDVVDDDDRHGFTTLDWLWSSVTSNDVMQSVVVDLAELDSGCVETSELKDFSSDLEVDTHRLLDNLKPIERYGLILHRNPEYSFMDCVSESCDTELSLNNRYQWEAKHQMEIFELATEIQKLDSMELLTYTSEDANRGWFGQNGQPMPLWPAPSPTNGTVILDGINNNNDLIELSFWYKTDRFMDESDLPPVYVKKDSLKRTVSEAGFVGLEPLPEVKPKFRKEESAHAPKSLFDRPTPALIKARKDMRLQKFRGAGSGVTPINSPAPVAGIRTPLPRTQVEAENSPEWLIQEDWALYHAVKDLLELPLNLTVLHPAHVPNWDMVADMVNSVSRIYRGPRQCRNRYEAVIVPREEGRILYDIIPMSANSPNNGLNPKKQKKNKNVMIPTKANRPMKTSQLFSQDSNNKWTSLFKSRFENIKSVANKRTPTAKPLLVNPTQKNPKHAAVLAESGISYDSPLSPITVAQNRAERIQKEKQRNQQQQQHELAQQRIASAQAAANAAQQSAAATAARVAAVTAQQQQQSQTQIQQQQQQQQQQHQQTTTAQAVVVGISQPSVATAQNSAVVRQQQQQQLQELVRSSNAAVVVTSPSAVVSLASLGRLQAAQKVVSHSGRPLTPHQINLLRQQAIFKPGDPSSSAVSSSGQKLRMQTPIGSKVSVAVTPSGTLQASGSNLGAVTVVTQAGNLPKTHQIRHLTTAGGSKTASVRAMTEQEMKILVAKQQQLQSAGKVQIPANVTAAQLFAQAGIKVQEGGTGQPVATLVKTVSAIGQQGQSVTIPVQGMNIPQVKAALARSGQQMQMKLLQQQLLQRKTAAAAAAGGSPQQQQQQQRVTIGQGKGLPTQLIVQKNVPHQAVTVQQFLKSVQQPGGSSPQLVSTPHAVLTKQSGLTTVATGGGGQQQQQQSIQARVIPVSAGGSGGRAPQTIQVVATSPMQRSPNVTIDASGRPTSGTSLANALVQGAHIKVAASSVANSQQILNQVSAALGQPVSMAVRTSDGIPVSVALRTATSTPKTIITTSSAAAAAAVAAAAQQQQQQQQQQQLQQQQQQQINTSPSSSSSSTKDIKIP